METNLLVPYQPTETIMETQVEDGFVVEEIDNHPHFIESNTFAVTMEELERDCIVPTFKDMEPVIAHQDFAKTVLDAAKEIFRGETFGDIEARGSHVINGRTPDALHLKASELRDNQKTKFYQRFAWCVEIKSKSAIVNGQEVYLTIGGTRSLHNSNLYARKAPEKFRIFISYRVKICSNEMIIQENGLTGTLECMTLADLYQNAMHLFMNFNAEKALQTLEHLGDTYISTQQFCQLIGRMRLYTALSEKQKTDLRLPQILLGDSVINSATRNFVNNPNFGINGGHRISCWQLMQLLNEGAKASYIDLWVDRNANCTYIASEVQKTITGETGSFSWFLT